MKKKSAIVFLFICVVSFVCWRFYEGGQTEHEEEIEYVIGISQANMREAWRLALISEIKEEAKKYQNVRIITTDATSDVDKQTQDVQKLLEFGIDLLIISPCDTNDMTQVVSEVYQKEKIPVIVMDRAVEGFDYSLFIGPDNTLIGHQAGNMVIELLDGKKGRVLELRGGENTIQSEERSEGFDRAIANHPEIKTEICKIKTELKEKDYAYDKLISMGDALKEIDVIFAYNDYIALGAYNALADMGMEDRIKIVGSDGFTGKNEGVDLVMQEKIAATISCPTGGREAIQYALNILKQESGVPKQVILRSHTITKENAEAYLVSLNRETADNGETIVVGYSQVGQESQWRLANTHSIQEAAKEFNVELVFDDANQSQKKQIAAIRRFIEQKVDVIVISPLVEYGWEEVLEEARDAGIPVVLSDRKIETKGKDLTTAYIGADFIEEGRRAMVWIRDHVPAGQKTMRILELQGNKGASPTEERRKGFEEILKANPDYRIVHSAYGDYTYEGGRGIIERYIEEQEWDIDIIYSHNDDMALGAIEALEKHGINPGVDVKIISVDGTKEAFQAMVDGKLNCAVECNPLLGAPLMKAVRDLVAGKEMPLRIITEEQVYDQSTAEDEIKNRAY